MECLRVVGVWLLASLQGVRCIVLYMSANGEEIPISTAVYRITTASERSRSTFLEIGAATSPHPSLAHLCL